jgi:hypothetical protein
VITSSCAALGTIVFSLYPVGGYTTALAASASTADPANADRAEDALRRLLFQEPDDGVRQRVRAPLDATEQGI